MTRDGGGRRMTGDGSRGVTRDGGDREATRPRGDIHRPATEHPLVGVIPAAALDAADAARWRSIQAGQPALSSPFFTPEFTQAVAAVRGDVFVARLEQADRAVGFFPFQRSRLGLGLPVGGPRSNYHGVIAEPKLTWDAVELVRACGLRTFDFDHLPVSQVAFQAYHAGRDGSSVIDLTGGFDGYVAGRRAIGSSVVARTEQQVRRLERAVGPVTFDAESDDRALLALLLAWKSAQYRATGQADRFKVAWNVALLERIHATRASGFAGTLSVLRAGDRVAALAFGMRSRSTWHYWFPAYDRQLATYSPGTALLLRMIEVAAARGLTTLDLGRHDEPYKARFRTGEVQLARGRVVVSRPTGALLTLRAGAIAATRDTPLAGPLRRLKRGWNARIESGSGI
jgi:CelD/BcsL family acetyltransferase involved in cellulose biosynthesis